MFVDNFSLPVYDKQSGDGHLGGSKIVLGRLSVGSQNGIIHLVSILEFLKVVVVGLWVIHRDSQNNQALVSVFFFEANQLGDGHAAGAAPGGPEIQ